MAAIAARLFYWQIISYQRFAIAAGEQHLTTISIEAPRGRILSADGEILVSNQPSYLLYASIPEIKKGLYKDQKYEDKVADIATKIQPILYAEEVSKAKNPDKLSQKEKETVDSNLKNNLSESLTKDGVVWVPLARKISENSMTTIKDLNFRGIGFEDQSSRFYPEGQLASSVLGFVGKDADGNDRGYFGLEGYYEEQLAGRSGKLTQEVDAAGKPIIATDSEQTSAKSGLDIETTIDRTVQYTVEKYLYDGAKKYGAKEASAIVMDPKTGAILAMASYPTYDPAKWNQYSENERRNNAISTVYEPGSTFKVVTASSGLDTGAVKVDTICPCSGPLNISGYQVQTWNNQYSPNSTMAQILEHSDNVGAAFWAQQMGKYKFVDYLHKFGFGSITGVDLQGEETGLINKIENWGDIEVVTGAFGQGISVTPLQMTQAVGAIANSGKMMEPYVVKKIITQEKEITKDTKSVGQIIKPEVAATMKELLLAAVENGEAKRIIPHGLRVGGKTGTAQIPKNGKYDPGKTVASFIGFGPIEDPRFVMIIKYTEPVPIYGAETAEPTFFKIAQDLYTYWGIDIHP